MSEHHPSVEQAIASALNFLRKENRRASTKDVRVLTVTEGGAGHFGALEVVPQLRSLSIRKWTHLDMGAVARQAPQVSILSLWDVDLADNEWLGMLPALALVDFRRSNITTLRPLLDCSLASVACTGCPIDEVSFHEVLPALRERGVHLHRINDPEWVWRISRTLHDRGFPAVAWLTDSDELCLSIPGFQVPEPAIIGFDDPDAIPWLLDKPDAADFEGFWRLAALHREAERSAKTAPRLMGRFGDNPRFADRARAATLNGHMKSARAWFALHRPADALVQLDAAIAFDPAHAPAHMQRGVVLERLGRVDEALEALAEAVRLDPDDHAAWTNLAFLTGRHHPIRGVARYDELLQRFPDDGPAVHNRAVLLRDLGRREEALAAFEHALRLLPDEPAVHVNLGVLHEHDDPEAARACYRRALALRPEFPAAEEGLARIASRA